MMPGRQPGESVPESCRKILTRGRRLVGATYPVLVKLNTTDGIDGPGDPDAPRGGGTLARHLVAWGVDAIEVSGGHREFKGVMSRPGVLTPAHEAYFAAAARAVRRRPSTSRCCW